MANIGPNLFKELLLLHQRLRDVLIMSKNQSRPEQPLQPLNHLQTLDPGIVVPGQPSMRMTEFVILRDVELIRGPDESPVVFKIDLHNYQAWRMARGMVQCNALEEIEMVFGKGIPFQTFEVHVVTQIDAQVSLGGDGPAGVLEFFFVDIDRHVCVDEVLEPAGVVQMQVANDHGFDVFDVVACGADGCWEFVGFVVDCSREDVG